MFHGGSGNGERFLKISGWREQADATGLIAVFPTGERYRITETGRLETRWASFGILDEIEEAETPPADDVAFVDAMLADIEAGLHVDAHRIYASGFSNGAGMAARLARRPLETFAAVAFSGGGLGVRAAAAPRRGPDLLDARLARRPRAGQAGPAADRAADEPARRSSPTRCSAATSTSRSTRSGSTQPRRAWSSRPHRRASAGRRGARCCASR